MVNSVFTPGIVVDGDLASNAASYARQRGGLEWAAKRRHPVAPDVYQSSGPV